MNVSDRRGRGQEKTSSPLPPSFLLNFQLSRQPRAKSFATQANFSYELIPFPDRSGKKVIFCYNHVQNNVKTNVFVYKKKETNLCLRITYQCLLLQCRYLYIGTVRSYPDTGSLPQYRFLYLL